MSDGPSTPRHLLVLRALALLLVLVALLIVALHLAPVQQQVLRALLPLAEDRADLRIRAERLDYNLFRLRATVSGVAVAASQTPDVPFFEAESVSVAAPSSILRGLLALSQVEIEGGRVRVVRNAAGSNLPQSSSTSSSEPAALQLGRIVADLAIDVRDEASGFSLVVPRLTVDLSPNDGQLALDSGRVVFGGQAVNVTRLAGGAAFDGRALLLRGVDVTSDVASARLDGAVNLVTRAPSLDLGLNGSGRVEQLVALATPARVFEGEVAFEGALSGPLNSPEASLRVRSDRLARDMVTLTAVDLTTRVDAGGAEISQAAFTLAGGRVEASGSVMFDGTGSRLEGAWTGVDLTSLVGSLVEEPFVLPSGATAGRLTSSGAGFDLAQWTTVVVMDVGEGANARGRVTMAGRSQLRVAGGSWQLEGQHNVGSVAPLGFMMNGRVQPDGRVPLAGSFGLDTTEISALVSVLTTAGLADVPSGFFTAGTATATGAVDGELTAPRLTGTAQLNDVSGEAFQMARGRVAFDATLPSADVDLDAHADSLEVVGQALTSVDGLVRIRGAEVVVDSLSAAAAGGSGALRAAGRYQLGSEAYQLQASVSNWRLPPSEDIPAGGVVSLDFQGAGTIARPAGEARATVTDAIYGAMPLGTITGQATLDGEQASFTLGVPWLGLSGRGRSGLAAPYTVTADVDIVGLSLAKLEPLMPAENVAFGGTASAAVHVEGPLSRWRDLDVNVNLTSAEAMLGELAVLLEGPAQVAYSSRSVSTVRLGFRAGGIQAEARGSLPLETLPGSSAAMTLSVIGDVGDILTAVRATGLVDVPAASGTGPVAVMARVEGAVLAPELSVDVDLGPASLALPNLPSAERVRLLGRIENGRVDVQDLFAVVDGAELTATASAPLAWASSPPSPQTAASVARLSARMKNVTAALLGRLATGAAVPDLGGSLDATIELTSTTRDLAGVAGEVRIDRLDVSAAGLAVAQRVPTRILAENGFARIVAWDWRGEGTSLSVAGQVRLSNLQTGILADGEVDLRLLSPFLRTYGVSTAGRLAPRLSITGELTHPRVDGDLTLSDGDLRLASPRVFVSGLSGRAILSRDSLQMPAITGAINGGDLTLGGSVSFTEGAPLTAALNADVMGMALEFPEGLRTELDGELKLDFVDVADGVPLVPVLSGSLRVVNGSYRKPITVVGGLLAALQSRSTAAPVPLAPGATPALAFNVTLITEQDIIVDNNVATLALDADVRLIGTIARPALSGRAEVREGGQVLLGRNTYRVTSGTLDFSDPGRIDPDLNFQLTTRAGGVPIDVALTGTASAPKLDLSSEDTELATNDLTSLLVTGRPLSQLGSADAALVGSVLVGNLSGEVGQVLGLAGRVVGIDTIRLGGVDDALMQSDPSAIATATDPTSRLTFGKSIGSNLDVTFSQSLRNGEAQTWLVEYLPTRRLLARLVSNDDNLRTYEFRHDIQFGGSTAVRARPAVPTRTAARVSQVAVNGDLAGLDVSRLIRLGIGDRFDFEALQDDRERLERFYRDEGYLTAHVGARQTTTGNAVEVTFVIQPGPRTRLDIVGEPLPDDLRARIADAWGDSIAGPLLIDEVQTLVADRLARDGDLRASIDVRLADVDGVQVLTIAVERGPRTREISVTLDGVSDGLADVLNERLNAERLVVLAPTDPQALVNSLEQALRERGYSQASVTVDRPVFEGESAVVNVRVQTGIARVIGTVTVVGSTLGADLVRQTLDLEQGVPFEAALVDGAQARLLSLYRQEGYPLATVAATTTTGQAEGVVAVSLAVKEGPRQIVSSVRIDGLRGIAEEDAREAMDLRIGRAARVEDVLRARTRLFSTGLFRRVDIATTLDSEADSTETEQPMRVVATVEEWPAVRLRYGFQVAEERPDDESRRELVPGLSADATRRTLFGRAINVGGAAVVQRRDRLGRIFVSSPRLFAIPLRTSLVLQKRREEFAFDNVSDTTSVSWEQRTTVFGGLVVAYSYRFDRVHSFVTGPPDPNFPAFDVSLNVARFTASGAWDSRNDPATPSRGSLLTSSIEDATSGLGSQIRFVRYFGQARHFQSWRGTVFGSAFQFGTVTPLGGQEVIPSERFYTGGSTSIRGLAEDGAGERDVLGPVGGRVLMLFNQEARIPVHRWFQGVAFVDAGNVFAAPADVSVRRLTMSVGLGVRVVTPFALLRFDYGRLVRNVPEDNPRGRWTFGIGHAF